MQASPGCRFLLLPIIVGYVNRDRWNWFATLTVFIGPSHQGSAAVEPPLTEVC
jgi:hypothetical protein